MNISPFKFSKFSLREKILAAILASSLFANMGLSVYAAGSAGDYVKTSNGVIEYDGNEDGEPDVKFSADDLKRLEASVITSEEKIEEIEEEFGDDPDTPISDQIAAINEKLNSVVVRTETAEDNPNRTIAANADLLYNGFRSGTVSGDVSSLPNADSLLSYTIPAGIYNGTDAVVEFDLSENNQSYYQQALDDVKDDPTIAGLRGTAKFKVTTWLKDYGDPTPQAMSYIYFDTDGDGSFDDESPKFAIVDSSKTFTYKVKTNSVN